MQKKLYLLLLALACKISYAQNFTHKQAKKINHQAWQKTMPSIVLSIKKPSIPSATVFYHTAINFKQRLQHLIDSMHAIGGGKIIVPAGNYNCNGPIHLKSNIELHLQNNCMINFSTNPLDYLPVVKVRWEGTVCYNYSPFVYAYQQENFAITGNGTLNGNAQLFWYTWKKQANGDDQEKDKKILRDIGRDGIEESKRIFGSGHKLRPSLIELYECNNILIDSIQVQQSPFWTIHPVFSSHITISNITIKKGTTNDDGIDPDGCEYVLIENCTINTDDDPISIKAGRDNDAWKRKQTKNIVIRNIIASSNVGNGFCIGSEMSGGVENVFVENYTITKADHGINIKSNLDRGGFVKNIYIRHVTIDTAMKAALIMQKDYHSYRGGNYPPTYSNIFIENIATKIALKKAIRITGVASKTINNIWINNWRVNIKKEDDDIRFTNNVFINKKLFNN